MFGRASRTEYRRGVKGKPKHPGWEFFVYGPGVTRSGSA